jgi:TolB-like protein/DNA-binding winged helix-turn-helix (wHTH) protein/Tfp pilus assembly protein PilF
VFSTSQSPHGLRFGIFEIDLDARELKKNGLRVKLQEQPCKILAAMARRAGEVIPREELYSELSTHSTYDSKHGLNNAIQKIREVLGDSPENARFIETVPGRGYRFLPQVEVVYKPLVSDTSQAVQDHRSHPQIAQINPPIASTPFTTLPAVRKDSAATAEWNWKHWRLWRSLRVTSYAALAALLVVTIWFILFREPGEAIDSVAVLPFVNASTDPGTDYLIDGITETLIGQLSQIPRIKVMARSTVIRYQGSNIDPQKVGRDLKVGAVLTGRVLQRGDELTISMELVNVRDGSELWAGRYNRKLADILAVQEDIAREITDKLRLRLESEEKKRLIGYLTENPEAYQLYLNGRYYWNKRAPDNIQKAIDYFNAAIAKDSRYALAYAGLADCYHVPANPLPPRQKMPLAKVAAMMALQLDDTLAEAHTSLARVLFVYDWDWPAAETEFKRAIELNPRYAPAREWYGEFLAATGRFREADAQKKQALTLEPRSLIVNFDGGLVSYFSRDYDQAIDRFQKTLELDANFPAPYQFLGAAYEQRGVFEKAITAFQKAITVTQGPARALAMAGLAHVYAVSGRKTEAHKILAELQRLSEHSYVQATVPALVYAGLGENDQAFAWLDKAYEEHSFSLSEIKVEPRFDPLRSDPRFADLLRRMGLPP